MGEWKEMLLGDVIELKRGYDLPTDSRRPGPYPVVSSSGPVDAHAEYKACAPGVVTGRYGTIGVVYYITTNFWPLNTALYVRNFKGNDPRFVHYFLQGFNFASYSDKSAVPGVNRNHLHQAKVNIPTLPTQRRIAHILGTLDDKIELNRRMNRTMEKMAAAIFKSWFIDFDPVHAKAEGRDTGLPAEIADLFPDSFDDSDIGPIPKGWKVSKIGELIELAYGKSLRAQDRRPGSVAVYGSNGQVGWHDTALVTGPGIVVGRKGNPGIVTWSPSEFFPIDTTFYVVAIGLIRSLHFLFHALKNHNLVRLGADSAVPGLNRNMAYMSQQVVSPPDLITAFDSFVKPLCDRIHSCERQNHRLSGLRDTLLPKLMGGEVEAPAAEATAEEGT